MTSLEPVEMLVLIYGFTLSPKFADFFASNPAHTLVSEFKVFVPEAIVATTTDPLSNVNCWLL